MYNNNIILEGADFLDNKYFTCTTSSVVSELVFQRLINAYRSKPKSSLSYTTYFLWNDTQNHFYVFAMFTSEFQIKHGYPEDDVSHLIYNV